MRNLVFARNLCSLYDLFHLNKLHFELNLPLDGFFRVDALISGLPALYRGISTNIACSAPISAVYTFTYESVKAALLPLLPRVTCHSLYSIHV